MSDFTTWRSLVDGEEIGVIPDSVVNRLALDEGDGSSVEDSVGSANGTLFNDEVWTDDAAFEGATAPFFDETDDYAEWSPRTEAPITWTLRVRLADPPDLTDAAFVFGHNVHPGLRYQEDGSDEIWRGADADGGNRADVIDPVSNAQGDIRVIAYQLDSAKVGLDVWDGGGTHIGGDETTATTDTNFDGSTMFFGDVNDTATRPFGDNIDLIDIHDQTFESFSEINGVVQQVYF